MMSDEFDEALRETKRAAKDLAASTARLSRRVVTKAKDAAAHPSATARRAAQRVAKELDAAANDIERILRDL